MTRPEDEQQDEPRETERERISVWPKPGITVRDPITRQPIEPGQEVFLTREILRRLKDGDLTREAPEAAGDKEHGVTRTPDRRGTDIDREEA